MTIILATITSIYLAIVTVEDLKDRAIHTFPCYVLSVLWATLILGVKTESRMEFIVYIFICFILAKAFNFKKVWGAGDSDLFLLFTILCGMYQVAYFTMQSLCIEVLLFAVAMLLALGIAVIEAKIKKQKLDKSSSIAVAPGLAIVMLVLMWRGVIG